jgi:hypothetical protein
MLRFTTRKMGDVCVVWGKTEEILEGFVWSGRCFGKKAREIYGMAMAEEGEGVEEENVMPSGT